MKFVAFNHYNNNTDLMHGFKTAAGLDAAPELTGARVSTSGICFFNLHKKWNDSTKLEFLSRLHKRLKDEFGTGFAAVILPNSDSTLGTFTPFFDAVAGIDSSIKKIQVNGPPQDITHADFRIEYRRAEEVIRQVMDAAGVTDQDVSEANDGDWKDTQKRFKIVYDAVKTELSL